MNAAREKAEGEPVVSIASKTEIEDLFVCIEIYQLVCEIVANYLILFELLSLRAYDRNSKKEGGT